MEITKLSRKLREHPTVIGYQGGDRAAGPLDAAALRALCLELGADDVGFVSLDREEVCDQRADVLHLFPRGRTLVSLVARMNRETTRSPARSASNLEFHATTEHLNDVARRIVAALEARGIGAVNPAAGFPMEIQRFPGKIWIVAHKPVAVAAGLGRMGIHRNVIHPRFGNFIILDTLVIDRDVDSQSRPLDFNPCLECKLCVAACPVGAIGADGHFDFSACANHNYHEFMGGFTDWVGTVADSADRHDYAQRVSDSETASMWQSLAFGPNYKAAYCLSVCPAGSDVIGPFLENRAEFLEQVVRPLQEKEETLYIAADTDAEAHARRRFPHKTVKRIRSHMRPTSIEGFLGALPLVFQRGVAGDLRATYHFTFTRQDAPSIKATVCIADGRIDVKRELLGTADCTVNVDARVWLRFIRQKRGLPWAILRGRCKVKGLRWLRAFGRCLAS